MFKVPITIVNGFLGAGKTTQILNVMDSLQKQSKNEAPPKIVWLKNEFGVNEVDSVLARQSALSSVKEIQNGCICCTLVGKQGEAVKEILDTTPCDRIIIETSGSAYPAPLALEINRLANGTDGVEQQPIVLDGVICVIDAVNFGGYEDTFTTARLQAKYTDLLVVNKSELAGKEQTDRVVDQLLDLNPETPIIYTKQGLVHPDILFGIDQRTDFGISLGQVENPNDVDVMHVEWVSKESESMVSPAQIEEMQAYCGHIGIFRVKGVIQTGKKECSVLNWAFGNGTYTVLGEIPVSARSTLVQIYKELEFVTHIDKNDNNMNNTDNSTNSVCSRLTIFGLRCNSGMIPRKISKILGLQFKGKIHNCHHCTEETHEHTYEYTPLPMEKQLLKSYGFVTPIHHSYQH